jgi:HSP20 family molecular chaperone IbpA
MDQEDVMAKFGQGVLNITVPRVEKKGARRIKIKAN